MMTTPFNRRQGANLVDFNSILNQVLSGGQQIARQGGNLLGGVNRDTLKGFGGGVAATGLLSLLMGRKGFGRSALELGSMAALGALAYNAWKNYQGGQQAAGQQQPLLPATERSPAQAAQAGELTVKVMIAAAAADGRIDEAESQNILTQIGAESAEVRQWLEAQLRRPATPQEIAAAAGDDRVLASELYLAARVVCGELDRKEIVFLHELATALKLDDGIIAQLEQQAGF